MNEQENKCKHCVWDMEKDGVYCSKCKVKIHEGDLVNNPENGIGSNAIHQEENTGWEKEFDKMCYLTVDGKCKYWKPESFGYAENDTDAPLDKFFPEEIKYFIQSLLSRQASEIKQTFLKECEEEDALNSRPWKNYNLCRKEVIDILDSYINK